MIRQHPTMSQVYALPSPHPGVAACVCQNLAIAADAFARLDGDELFALPTGLRLRTRDALVGVWQILDLMRRLEEGDGCDAQFAELEMERAGLASAGSPGG